MTNIETKMFTHFDKRISFDKIKDKIQTPEWIAQHGFYPFLHFEIIFNKYNRLKKLKKNKIRKIYYASHIDGYTFSYYGNKLNECYNLFAANTRIDNISIAYRNNKRGKNNIHFASEVIKYISELDQAFIFVADFTDFFDNLDHKYLKEKLKETLDVRNLPTDYYNIFKNITKYSYINKKDLERHIININEDTYFSHKHQYLKTQQFKEFKYGNIHKNVKPYGIPQGSGISAVLSNVYLIDFDRKINSYVTNLNGMYRRYCDDIIIVIPLNSEIAEDKLSAQVQMYEYEIKGISNKIPNLIIHPDKTNLYLYRNCIIKELHGTGRHLDYLGFRFDGQRVFIREKSLFKFYTRAYKKVHLCNKLSSKHGRKVNRRSLYKTYTHLGRKYPHPKNKKVKGNFITYAERAQQEFQKISTIDSKINSQIRRHWIKIQKKINGLVTQHQNQRLIPCHLLRSVSEMLGYVILNRNK